MRTSTFLALVGCLVGGPLLAGEAGASATDLFRAIREGDAGAVRQLLRSGADLNARNEFGDTPLMAAAWQADAAVVELLIKAGADVNAKNDLGVTPLLRAATFEDKVRLLVSAGAAVNARSKLGNTPLILAARKVGNRGTVQFLLDHGADVQAKNALGWTALHSAVDALDLEIVQLLLDRGAPVAAPGMAEPLGKAAFSGNVALTRLLLQRGASVDAPAASPPLIAAAIGGQVETARVLLEAGASVHVRDSLHYTPLHWAAASENSSPALVELLIARGADVNAEGGQSVDNFLGVAQTPLMFARRRGDTPIVRALLKAGAKDTPGSGAPEKSRPTPSGWTGSKTVAEAIARALPPLTRTAEETVPTFRRHATKQDCISCHQQMLPTAALSLARARRFAADPQVIRHQIELIKKDVAISDPENPNLQANLQLTAASNPGIYSGHVALNLQLEHEPATPAIDAMIHMIATAQYGDGHWAYATSPRPPMQISPVTATAMAVYALQAYPLPGRRQELAARVERARRWLKNVSVETNQDRVHQILGQAWAGAPPASLDSFVAALLREQRSDGGWAQLAALESDAFATGQTLYALLDGPRLPASHPAVRRGIEFLLRTQAADGTWHVRTRSHPFQPPMDPSFPYGKDAWISAAGTSWAVMALALGFDATQAPPAPVIATRVPAGPANHLLAPVAPAQPIDFVRDIQPIFERSCVACHSGAKAKGGFRITDRASLLKGGNRGEPAVVPGSPERSSLLRVVRDQIEDQEMPPLARRAKYPALTASEIGKLAAWIGQGAPWSREKEAAR